MMSITRIRMVPAWVVLGLAGLLGVGGCGGAAAGGPTGAAAGSPARDIAGQTITVYSGQHEQTASLLAAGFTAATGIKVALRSGDEAELANQILQEGTASPADVFYAENPPALEALREKNLLAPVDAATLAAVPAAYNSPQGRWVGVSARSAALVFNTAATSEAQLPASVLDMAGPAWKGRFGFAPTETDFQPVLTAVAKLKGTDVAARWLADLKADAKVYPDNETLVAAVNNGEIATGLIDHYYWYRLARELGPAKTTSALHYFGPGDPGSLVDVSGAGVLASSKHAAAAQKFLAYLVSKPAQMIIGSSDSYEYPLGSGVSTSQPLRPLDQLHPPALTASDLGDGRSSLAMLQQAGLL
ncbi:MAG: iron ABC transporter substrate-binding protein [Pseudonocardiales bacterium]|nr:iron ABC transporter substrate-binding protein [Pseudonocardiales bacterium]MBV9032493.1 iron ABC transporter substrate-binding protein [Pseudonocardiales bacterium]MBW0008596.1 iron ABC transporter substrate-binding protein [Pseudonocardiales bacterium]